MKATLWLVMALAALLSVTNIVTAQQYDNSRLLQDNFLIPQKRTKPSLSIVNPLDVLRQRIILEMARRQMRENTKQVEINKAYLKNIGKRGPITNNDADYTVFDDFERHLLDTNSYKTPHFDDNPEHANVDRYLNKPQYKPNYYLHRNPDRQTTKINYTQFPTMDSTAKNKLANKSGVNTNKIMDEDDGADNNVNNNNNNIDIAFSNPSNSNSIGVESEKPYNKDANANAQTAGAAYAEPISGNGNDDDNFQIKYMYSLYKNRYNVNNV